MKQKQKRIQTKSGCDAGCPKECLDRGRQGGYICARLPMTSSFALGSALAVLLLGQCFEKCSERKLGAAFVMVS